MINSLRTFDNWLDYQLSRRLRWPQEVYINVSPQCNKQCDICTYDPKTYKDVQGLRLEDFKKMTWLRHAKLIGLWCGNGESLLNPEFESILDYRRATWPHLRTHLSTNGTLLTRNIGNKISYINVSLNTSKVSPSIINELIHIKTAKTISFVMTLDNIHEAPDFVLVAARVNATAVLAHCMFHSWRGNRPIAVEKSCYNDPDKTNHYLRLAHQYAQQWGVQLWAPPLLGQESYICRGSPTHLNLPYCSDPFKRVYLTIDEYGKHSMVVCCSGCYFDVEYDITDMTPAHFKSLWNSKPFKHLRRTANKPAHGGNPLCAWCKHVNRFLPDAERGYERIKRLVKSGAWMK